MHQGYDNHMLDLIGEFHSFQAQTGESISSYMARFLVLFDKLKAVGIDMTKVIPKDHAYWYIIENHDDLQNHFGLKPVLSGDPAVQTSKAEGLVRSHVSKARSRPPKLKVRQLNARRILNPNKPISISTILVVNEGDLTMSCTNATEPVKVWEATT